MISFLNFVIQNMIHHFENHKRIISCLHTILSKNKEKFSAENIMQCVEFYSSDVKIL